MEKNILVAFILNLVFSVFEFFGGIFTGSVAIISDAVHDLGDAASIGLSYAFERKSKKQPDEKYTYGYARYSALAGFITTLILIFGSLMVMYNAVGRIIEPQKIDYDSMIVFAVLGVCVNFCAAFVTRGGGSTNQKSVNLHMIEDVLGWAVVLIGAVVMKFSDFVILDPIMSIGVSVFILINAIKNLKEILNLFLEKTPYGIDIQQIREHLCGIDGVLNVHHIHIWSMDIESIYATMHVVTNKDPHEIKDEIRKELRNHGIVHATLEIETDGEHCHEENCIVEHKTHCGCHHHHHH